MEPERDPSQATQQNTNPANAVSNPNQPTLMDYVTMRLKVFGGIHLTWAVVYIVLGMVDVHQCVAGSVGGPLFLVIGSFSITTGLLKHKKLILTMMIFSIICAMACGVMLIITSLMISYTGHYPYYYENVPIKGVVILIGTLIEGGISIGSAVVCSKFLRCRPHVASSYAVMPEPQLTACNDVMGLEGGVGYDQAWCSPQQKITPGVANPAEAGIDPPAYDALPENNP